MRLAAILLSLAVLLHHGSALAWTGPVRPAPPDQPASGPGGRDAPFRGVLVQRHGEPPTGYTLLVPEDPVEDSPLRALPLVIFLHGFTAVEPDSYLAWLEHIARRGAVVVYPDYQTADPFGTPWAQMLPNAVAAVQDALAQIETDRPGLVDASRSVVVGHSLGGVLAMNLAAVADGRRIPAPLALMVVQPGGCTGCDPVPADAGVALGRLAEIDPDTRLMMMVGADDGVVGDAAARILWDAVPQIPPDRRDFVTVLTDTHGDPALQADHALPQTDLPGGPPDAYDWYGTWKLFDLLFACATEGSGCDRAAGGAPAQRDMGAWSDGRPVLQPVFSDGPVAGTPTP